MDCSGRAEVLGRLSEGDRVEVTHEVKVGFRRWTVTTRGVVVGTERRRHGLHHDRGRDDVVLSDVIVLARDDGERTAVTLDPFSQVKKLSV